MDHSRTPHIHPEGSRHSRRSRKAAVHRSMHPRMVTQPGPGRTITAQGHLRGGVVLRSSGAGTGARHHSMAEMALAGGRGPGRHLCGGDRLTHGAVIGVMVRPETGRTGGGVSAKSGIAIGGEGGVEVEVEVEDQDVAVGEGTATEVKERNRKAGNFRGITDTALELYRPARTWSSARPGTVQASTPTRRNRPRSSPAARGADARRCPSSPGKTSLGETSRRTTMLRSIPVRPLRTSRRRMQAPPYRLYRHRSHNLPSSTRIQLQA